MLRSRLPGQPRVEQVSVPARVLDAALLDRVDYADAFHVDLRAENVSDLITFGREVASFPGWVRALMAIRDSAVKVVGLRTTADFAADNPGGELAPGGRLGAFRVFRLDDDEIVVGENDSHLDFRVSLLRDPASGDDATDAGIVLTTVVQFNNWLGRAYFAPVRIGHVLIVPSVMRRAALRLSRVGDS